ncbi:glycoside hydrolase family 172 protein [Mucisphaera sp.]|uniref:glycoside hydrolase family 172 protein n=1 Tax=Mucisphaera sp. TaxID=2913024 RepID=UPI003D0BB6EE
MPEFDGLFCDMGNIHRLSKAQTRSISAENPTGAKAQGGRATEGISQERATDLGRGWKINPAIEIQPGNTAEIADIDGPGALQHLWMTPTGHWRFLILRIYWDNQDQPSVECPMGDFFACGWGSYAQVSSIPVTVNPGSALNCYWPMPFRKHCRITVENVGTQPAYLYYQIDYALNHVPEDAAYFHAQFRRANPQPYGKVFTILEGIKGHGHYVGTYMAWGVNNRGWWGEGEIKFYIDGDLAPDQSVDNDVAEHGGSAFPTICGTGTEDYFLGSYNFENPHTRQYQEYTTPYAGMPQVIRPDGVYESQQRFGLYRWHIPDPIRFHQDLTVTIQALGWRKREPIHYLPLQDDIASVAYWYQSLPTPTFPTLPHRDQLEVV